MGLLCPCVGVSQRSCHLVRGQIRYMIRLATGLGLLLDQMSRLVI